VTTVQTREIQDAVALIVCGSRTFKDEATFLRTIQMCLAYKHITVFHGACLTGADEMAARFFNDSPRARLAEPTLVVREYPADFGRLGRRAGPLRNQQMVDHASSMRSQNCRVVCLAYWDGNSRGTLDCLTRAVKAGIETGVIPPDPRSTR